MKQKMKLGVTKPVENSERRFGSANSYHAVWIEYPTGPKQHLFTNDELHRARQRALVNPEDMPALLLPPAPKCRCFLCRLKRFFHV